MKGGGRWGRREGDGEHGPGGFTLAGGVRGPSPLHLHEPRYFGGRELREERE